MRFPPYQPPHSFNCTSFMYSWAFIPFKGVFGLAFIFLAYAYILE
ncbi:hypothetical protein HanIR_Chr08g0352971 [Helianthus annuus]|nr:hypothetical protein HanIR_Chr08g0352971 [Helianthus annuus]